jgi:hypothetical protein
MKNYIITFVILLISLQIGGCSYPALVITEPKYNDVIKYDFKKIGADGIDQVITIAPGMNSISRSSNAKQALWFNMQIASELAKSKGYNYFSILLPKYLSHIEGSTISTPEELYERCTNESFGSRILSAVDKTNLDKHACGIFVPGNGAQEKTGISVIVMYKEKPIKFIALNADDMLHFIQEKGLFTQPENIKRTKLDDSAYFWRHSYSTWCNKNSQQCPFIINILGVGIELKKSQ